MNNRKLPLEINSEKAALKPLFITDGFGDIYQVSSISINESNLITSIESKESIDFNLEAFAVANTFLWKNPQSEKLHILVETQLVLFKIEKLFNVEWHYGIITMNGYIVTPKNNSYYPQECSEIWIVSKEEYLYNTSRSWAELNSEHAWRKNSDTDEYII